MESPSYLELAKCATSELHDGIEIVSIMLDPPWLQSRLVWALEHGGKEAAIAWIMQELGRPFEVDRVCGIAVESVPRTVPLPHWNVQPSRIAIKLELRQPGKQFEAWLYRGSIQGVTYDPSSLDPRALARPEGSQVNDHINSGERGQPDLVQADPAVQG